MDISDISENGYGYIISKYASNVFALKQEPMSEYLFVYWGKIQTPLYTFTFIFL